MGNDGELRARHGGRGLPLHRLRATGLAHADRQLFLGIASLVHYSGLDPTQTLPYGIHLSPGTSTLLGTSGDDHLRVEHGFTTLLGGRGGDSFFGSAQPRQVEKFYGGEGDDIFRWSPGFNIVHGGQPQLGYAADGADVIDYSGAGEVTITFNRHWVPHKSPNFVAVFETGTDHLFSVERIQWNAKTDRIVLGKDIDLLEDDRVLQPGAELHEADVRSAAIVAHDAAIIGDASTGDDSDNRIMGTHTAETIDAKAGDDTLYGGEGDDLLIGGTGSDAYVYLQGDGDDVVVDLVGDADVDELVLAGGISAADVAVFRIGDGDLLLAVPGGSILVEGFFAASGGGIERVVFDHAAHLTRADLELLAGDAPPTLLAEDAPHLPATLSNWTDMLGSTAPAEHVEPFEFGLF